jgi:hypothetical protein
MSKEEYDVLIWVTGNFANEFNLAAMLVMISISAITFINYYANKIQAYIRYRSDVDFWTNTLTV